MALSAAGGFGQQQRVWPWVLDWQPAVRLPLPSSPAPSPHLTPHTSRLHPPDPLHLPLRSPAPSPDPARPPSRLPACRLRCRLPSGPAVVRPRAHAGCGLPIHVYPLHLMRSTVSLTASQHWRIPGELAAASHRILTLGPLLLHLVSWRVGKLCGRKGHTSRQLLARCSACQLAVKRPRPCSSFTTCPPSGCNSGPTAPPSWWLGR